MIAETVGFILRNLPAVFLVVALAVGSLRRVRRGSRSERLLSWILLLPIGATGVWAAVFHIFFPAIAAADIGWAPSPFQFEVGVADLAFGATACIAFWCSLPFKAAVVCVASTAPLGDAVGHVHQMVAGNFAPGNAGVPFWTDVIVPALAIVLLAGAWRRRSVAR